MNRKLRQHIPISFKRLVKAAIFAVKGFLTRLPVSDERRESTRLKKVGLLGLGPADMAVLNHPLGRYSLRMSNASALDTSRWFFHQLDAPMRRTDIASYSLCDIPYWDSILGNHFRPFEMHWVVNLLRSRAQTGGSVLEPVPR